MTTSEIARVALLAGMFKPKLTKAEKQWNDLWLKEIELLKIVRTSSGRRYAKYAQEYIKVHNELYPPKNFKK